MESRIETTSEDERCAGCHAAQTAEWRESMHHASFTSRDFQASWQHEPREYCIDCHAPRRALGAIGLQAGVGCVECHDGLAEHLLAPTRAPTTRSCVPCHDFPVPNQQALLQTTGREHAASDFANVECADCHAPRRGDHRDHRFASSRDPERLAAAVAVAPLGFDGQQISVELRTRGVGHRFPTGDIFRRVTVQVTGTTPQGRIVCDHSVSLSRDWAEHRRSLLAGDAESFDGDTRLGSDPLRIDAACVDAPTQIRVTVDYARGAAAHGDGFTAFAELALIDVAFDVQPRPTGAP